MGDSLENSPSDAVNPIHQTLQTRSQCSLQARRDASAHMGAHIDQVWQVNWKPEEMMEYCLNCVWNGRRD